MFDVGKSYALKLIFSGDERYEIMEETRTVESIDGVLIRFTNGTILNTASPMFFEATDTVAQRTHHRKSFEDLGRDLG